MATPPANTEQTFDDAFAEAMAADAKAVPASPDATASTAQDPPAGDAKPDAGAADAGAVEGAGAEGTGAEGEAAAAAVEAAAAGAADKGGVPAVPAAAAAAAAAGGETPEQELARLRTENAALAAARDKPAPAAPAEPAAPAAPAAAAAPAEPKWYQPAAEETERIQAFEKEWPDIHSAVQALVKQAGYNAAEYVFHTIAKTYNPTLQEFAQLSQTMQEQLALGALRAEHNDYDAIYDNVVVWVDTLSPAFKRGAKQVMESGTPEEVNDLITAYKETDAYKLQLAAAGGAKPAATLAPAPAVNTAALSAAAKKAAGKLQVVGSKRTTPVAPAAADDFDGAWAEALRVS